MNTVSRAVKMRQNSVSARMPSRWSPTVFGASRVLSVLILGLAVFEAVVSVLIVYRYHSPALCLDQWVLVDKLMHSAGKLTLSALWAQHNEHRIPVAWLTCLMDLRWFGGRNTSLFVETFLVQAGAALLFAGMFRKFAGRPGPPFLTVAGLAVFCAFCPLQMENFIWGFQVAFVLSGFAASAAFACAIWHCRVVARNNRRWISGPLVLSFGAAFVAQCGLAAGLAVWPILVLLGFILRFPRKSQALTAAAGTIAAGCYFVGYHSPPQNSDPFQTLRHPLRMAKYVVTYFGHTWDASLPSTSSLPAVSELVTGLALIFAIVSICRLCFARKAVPDLLRCFLAANLLFAIATAVLTSLGRLKFGIGEAMVSRYQTISLVFWASLAALLLVSLSARRSARLSTLAVQIGIVALMLLAAGQFKRVAQSAQDRRTALAQGYAALANPQTDQRALANLYPNPAVPAWYAYLRSQEIGPDASEVARQAPHVVESSKCDGAINRLQASATVSGSVLVSGWAWDIAAGSRPEQVMLILGSGQIAGRGPVEMRRQDVQQSRPDVTDPIVGWQVEAAAPHGSTVRAFAVLNDSVSVCPVGNAVVVP